MRPSNVMWIIYAFFFGIMILSIFILGKFNGVAFIFALLASAAFFRACYLEDKDRAHYSKEYNHDSD